MEVCIQNQRTIGTIRYTTLIYTKFLPEYIYKTYEVYDYGHASTILSTEFRDQYDEIIQALEKFALPIKDILAPGGNESPIPKQFSKLLRPFDWREVNLEAELRVYERKGKIRKPISRLDHGSHKVDYMKGRVAFDLEWNSKDQTFDRDLYAFRAFFEYNAISLGVLVTRGYTMAEELKQMGVHSKYGASTTHMGKLIPRLEAGRNGGCPVLVFGITPKLIVG